VASACWFSCSDACEQNENIPLWRTGAKSYLLPLFLPVLQLIMDSVSSGFDFPPQHILFPCAIVLCGTILKLSGQTEIMQKSTESTMSRKWQHWQGQRATNILLHAKRDWNTTHELLIQQRRRGSQIRPSWVNRKQRTKDEGRRTSKDGKQKSSLGPVKSKTFGASLNIDALKQAACKPKLRATTWYI